MGHCHYGTLEMTSPCLQSDILLFASQTVKFGELRSGREIERCPAPVDKYLLKSLCISESYRKQTVMPAVLGVSPPKVYARNGCPVSSVDKKATRR